MGEHPGSHEEAELDLGLFGVSRVHMDDAARESTAAMGDAAVTQQRPDELVQKRRLADADLERHRFDYAALRAAVDQPRV